MRKRISLLVMAVVIALTMSLGGAAAAFAKIEPVTRNPAGNETQGQGQALTTTNENPSGKAPPGQN
jgi:hypothetical protein